MATIYLIRNKINEKYYIGKTTGSVSTRFKQHLYDSGTGKSTSSIHHAIRKYGKENFTISILSECNEYELDNLERAWILLLNSQIVGYNQTLGGEGSLHPIEVLREKFRQNRLGKKLTQETKDKIRLSSRGRKQSKEVIECRISKIRGRKQSEKTREILRKAWITRSDALEMKVRLRAQARMAAMKRWHGENSAI